MASPFINITYPLKNPIPKMRTNIKTKELIIKTLSALVHSQIQKKKDERKAASLDSYEIQIILNPDNVLNFESNTNNDNLTTGIIMQLLSIIKFEKNY